MKIRFTMMVSVLAIATLLFGFNVADGSPKVRQSTPTPQLPAELETITAASPPPLEIIGRENSEQLIQIEEIALEYPITALDWSPDGEVLAIGMAVPGDPFGGIWLFHVETDNFQQLYDSSVTTLAFHPTEPILASARGATIMIWDVETSEAINTFTDTGIQECLCDSFIDLHYSPDGHYLAIGTEAMIQIRDANTGDEIHTLYTNETLGFGGRGGEELGRIDFHPTESAVAFGHSIIDQAYMWYFEQDTDPIVFDIDESQDFLYDYRTRDVKFSSDGTILATFSWNGMLRLWDVETQTQLHSLTDEGIFKSYLAFSPDGNLIVAADFTIRIWDVDTGELLSRLESLDLVSDIAFNPRGTLLASGGDSGVIRLWGVPSGQE